MIAYKKKFSDINCKFSDKQIELLINSIKEHTDNYIESNQLNNDLNNVIFDNRLNDILFNLKENLLLTKKINNNELNISDLPYCEPSDLNNELWKKLKDRKEYIRHKKNNMATDENYVCKKCKNRKAITWQLQTRSADEPMTTFVKCKVCMYTIKF